MLKRKVRILLIASLIISLIFPTYLTFVYSSSGNIRINTTGTSTPGQQIQAGGVVNLCLGDVIWSGDQFYLFLSQDDSNQMGSGLVYTPIFSVYDLANFAIAKNYTGDYGFWVVGSNWINGTLPSNQNPGNYYVKAVDGSIGSTVAVTDTYLTITAVVYNSKLYVSPPQGPGGTEITFTGSQWPSGSMIIISYQDPYYGWKQLTSVVASASGQISVTSEAPDLMRSGGAYDSPETYTSISYRAETAGGSAYYSIATFNEYHRGLKTVGNSTANGLYGNGTDLTSGVRTMVGDTITISGKNFHSGSPIYVRWDSVEVVGTVTSNEWLSANIIGTTAANQNGSFVTQVTIPTANAGAHYIAVEDSQTRITVKIFVSLAHLQISPLSGPGGATVQFTGSNFPASTLVDLYYLDPIFGTWSYWTSTSSTPSGQISFINEIPDLGQSAYSGDYSNFSSIISFKMQVNNVPYAYADYYEYARGLSQVGGRTAYSLFGNGTNLASSVTVNAGESLFISGKYFHPGIVYFKLDGVSATGASIISQEWSSAISLGSTTASQIGSFQTFLIIPTVNSGVHSIAIEDTGPTTLVININVVGSNPTPTPTPSATASPTVPPTPKPTSTPSPNLPTPTIDVTCKGATTSYGPKVEISGKLLLSGNAIAEWPVLISYSVTGGETWESLTLVHTRSDGGFVAVWYPDVTGNYLIKASTDATSTMNAASEIVNLALTPDKNQNVFTLNSNSTITQFAFNSTSNQLSFVASGDSGTTGYVEIYIPKTIINDISQLITYIDNQQVSFNSESQGDSWLITFSYSHSEHKITLVMGDASQVTNTGNTQIVWYAIPIIAIAVVAVAVVLMLKRKAKPNFYLDKEKYKAVT